MNIIIHGKSIDNLTPGQIEQFKPNITFWRGRRFHIKLEGKCIRIVKYNELLAAINLSLKKQTKLNKTEVKKFVEALESLKNKGYEPVQFKKTFILTRIFTRIKHLCSEKERNRLLKVLHQFHDAILDKPPSPVSFAYFNQLPSEIKKTVLSFLPSPDISSFAQASKACSKEVYELPFPLAKKVKFEQKAFKTWETALFPDVKGNLDLPSNVRKLSSYSYSIRQLIESFPDQVSKTLKRLLKEKNTDLIAATFEAIFKAKQFSFEALLPFIEDLIKSIEDKQINLEPEDIDLFYNFISKFLAKKDPERALKVAEKIKNTTTKFNAQLRAAEGFIPKQIETCLQVISSVVNDMSAKNEDPGCATKLMAAIAHEKNFPLFTMDNRMTIKTDGSIPANLLFLFDHLNIIRNANHFAEAYLTSDLFGEFVKHLGLDEQFELLLKRVEKKPAEAEAIYEQLDKLFPNEISVDKIFKIFNVYKKFKTFDFYVPDTMEDFLKDVSNYDDEEEMSEFYLRSCIEMDFEKARNLINQKQYQYLSSQTTIELLVELAKQYRQANKRKCAIEILDEALQLSNQIIQDEELKGDRHPKTIKALALIAENYFYLNPAKAKQIFEELYEEVTQNLGYANDKYAPFQVMPWIARLVLIFDPEAVIPLLEKNFADDDLKKLEIYLDLTKTLIP